MNHNTSAANSARRCPIEPVSPFAERATAFPQRKSSAQNTGGFVTLAATQSPVSSGTLGRCYVYHLNNWTFDHALTLDMALERIQGAKVHGEWLYMSSDRSSTPTIRATICQTLTSTSRCSTIEDTAGTSKRTAAPASKGRRQRTGAFDANDAVANFARELAPRPVGALDKVHMHT